MGNSNSLLRKLALPIFVVVLVGVAWINLGPGHAWLDSLFDRIRIASFEYAEKYHNSIEGSAKLIAPLATIGSFVYALWKWHVYAEKSLHSRLLTFVEREEKRLEHARPQLRAIIDRPGPARPFQSPIFATSSLSEAAHELGWGSYFLSPQFEFVENRLDSAIGQLNSQFKFANDRKKLLEKELATAQVLRGATWASRASEARKIGKDDLAFCQAALKCFDAALVLDSKDMDALEYASHMHVCLGQYAQAKAHLDLILQETAGQQKSLARSRAFRYKSLILANQGNPQPGVAKQMMKSALATLPNLQGSDWIEEAELHELLGDRQLRLNATKQARAEYQMSKAIFTVIQTEESSDGERRVDGKLDKLEGMAIIDGDDGDDSDGLNQPMLN